jgi:hypothetical protein
MQYLLLIYDPEKAWATMADAERSQIHAEYLTLTQDLKAAGQFRAGDALQSTHTATTVRVRDGKIATTDGPFAETREQLGGYYMVEAKDLDEATKIAARIPSARFGSIEIRPVMTFVDGKRPA